MGMSVKVHPANGAKNENRATSAKDRKLIDRLVKLWKSNAERDLGTRHRMGKLLNARLGPPTERQPHGQRVLELYGAELGISPSDLNRLGWLSHLFPDFSAFREQRPEIDNWTKFKDALPSLKPAKGGKAREPVASPSRPAFGGVARSIANLTSKLNGLDIRPRDAERRKLVIALRELAEAASSRLKIRVEVSVVVEESNPVATERLDRVARA
jgi:hypothetical protein